MNVFHLINTLSPAGAENVVKNLVVHTDVSDVSYGVGFLWGDDTLRSDIEAAGADVIDFDASFRYHPALVGRIMRHLQRSDVDVLHTHLPISSAVGRLAGRAGGVDHIISTQHNVPSNYQPVSRILERLTRPIEDVTVTISHGVRDAWGGPNWPVIYNGIDIKAFRDGVRHADNSEIPDAAKQAEPLLLNVGRYVPEKRQTELISMMASLTNRFPEAKLLIVGFGPLEEKLREAVRSYNLEEAVTVTGKVPRVEPYFSVADVFVSSLAYQGMGVAHFEAMAADLPVVSTDISDMREVVEDGTTGFLVPPGRPQLLADAIGRLDDPKLRNEMGAAGFERVKSMFSIERTAAEYIELYRNVSAGSKEF